MLGGAAPPPFGSTENEGSLFLTPRRKGPEPSLGTASRASPIGLQRTEIPLSPP